MIPTPDLSHLTRKDYEHVYEPAEDTFLLLDALEEDAQDLITLRPQISLEIGYAALIYQPADSQDARVLPQIWIRMRHEFHRQHSWAIFYLCTDINPHACRCTVSTGIQNKVSIHAINASFASPLHTRLKHSVDVILFNPPYVPTFADEAWGAQDTRDIEGAWAGGSDGMNVTDLFLERVEELMSPRARFYLVAVKENDIPSIRQRMLEKYGLRSEIVQNRRAGREHLFVLRFIRDSTAADQYSGA